MNPTLAQLFQLVPDALVLVDAQGRIVRTNEQADRLFQHAPGALAGQPVETLIPESLRGGHHAHLARYRAQPRVRPMGTGGQTLSGLRRDGSVFPVEIALSPLEQDGETLFIASIRDVSESQRARQALLRARYDRLVARVGEQALLAADADDVLPDLPGELCETLGVAAAAIFSQDHAGALRLIASAGLDAGDPALRSLPPSAFGPDYADNRAHAIAETSASDVPLARLLATAGFASALVSPLVERGRPLGALLALDRAAARFDADALHCVQAVGNLVSAMLQRRRAEERLAHAQRLEALGQLTGGIAHDFNNLLTVVSGNLQLLELQTPADPESRELIANALRAVDHGSALTAKLLAFGRRQRLTPRPIAAADRLIDLGSLLRRTLGDRIHLQVLADDGVDAIFADPAQLDAALLNLALNARDAMPRGGHLTIRAEKHDVPPGQDGDELPPGAYVCLSVTDTGVGMAPDVLARAFEPFFTTKDAGKGNGLGLSMVYGFARQSGGLLRARSQLGYGTRVELLLPVAAARSGGAGARIEPPTMPAGHVLVVEDEDQVRAIATAFVRSFGLQVTAVASADAALERLARDASITMLFSDISLGAGMSGVELAQRARERAPPLAILLTTGYDRGGARDAGADGGFTVLPKPYRREDLERALAALAAR